MVIFVQKGLKGVKWGEKGDMFKKYIFPSLWHSTSGFDKYQIIFSVWVEVKLARPGVWTFWKRH